MSDIALRPRSATEIVDAAFQVYRREPLQFIVGLGLIYVPWHVILALMNVDPMGGSETGDMRTLLLVPLALIVYALSSGVTISLASDVYFGHPVDVGTAFMRAVSKIGTLIATTFAVGLLIGLLAIAAAVIASVMPGIAIRAIIVVLAVIAAVYMAVRFFAVRQTIMLEDAHVNSAISRSWALSNGQWGHVAGSLLLAGLIVVVVMIGALLIAQMIPSRIVQSAISALASILIIPLFSIAETVLYFDVRIRNEGFDVEYLAAAAAEQAKT